MPTITGNRQGGTTGPYLTLQWDVLQTDVANNRSRVRLILRLHADYRVQFSASKSGVLQGSGFSYTRGANGTGSWELRRQEVWVSHNSDGSKTQNFSGSFNIAISFSGTYITSLSVGDNITLPVIPRASTLSAFSFNAHLKNDTANQINYTVDRKSDNFRHHIELRYGNTTIRTWDNISSNGVSTLPLTTTEVNNLMARMSTLTARALTLRVRTRSGNNGSWIGSAVSRNATATIHEDVKPSVWGLGVSIEGNAHAKNNVKGFVQNISKVSCGFARSGTGGAWIRSSLIEIRKSSGGADYQSINSNEGIFPRVVALSGQYQARGTATDSRGRSNSTGWTDLSNFDVLAYSAPTITEFKTSRQTNTPTTVDIRRYGNHSELGGNNELIVRLQKRASGTSSWSNVVPDFVTSNMGFGSTVESTGNSVVSSYEFRLYVFDQFGNSAEQISTVSSQRVVLDVHKNEGVGIGKIHERGVLDVDGEVYLNGKVMALGGLGFEDTRSVNDQPQHIPPKALSFAFKNSSTVGSPAERANPTYAHILNIAGWTSSEPSGGYPMQMSIGAQGISLRQGTSATAWGPWSSLVSVESGYNANGGWIRFNNGFQMCWSTVNLVYADPSHLELYWNFPKEFSTNATSGSFIRDTSWQGQPLKSSVPTAWHTETRAHLRLWAPEGFTFGPNSTTRGTAFALGRWK